MSEPQKVVLVSHWEKRVAELDAFLKTANSRFEEYERKYYLELDAKEAAEVRVKELEAEVKIVEHELRESLEYQKKIVWSLGYSHNQIRELESTIVEQQTELHALRLELGGTAYDEWVEKHKRTHLCLKKHSPEEPPDNGRWYLLRTHWGWTNAQWIELSSAWRDLANQYYTSSVLEWYSMPESEVEG